MARLFNVRSDPSYRVTVTLFALKVVPVAL
jgi:hypothetical protein